MILLVIILIEFLTLIQTLTLPEIRVKLLIGLLSGGLPSLAHSSALGYTISSITFMKCVQVCTNIL
jgi:hypothetical protein